MQGSWTEAVGKIMKALKCEKKKSNLSLTYDEHPHRTEIDLLGGRDFFLIIHGVENVTIKIVKVVSASSQEKAENTPVG